MGLHGRLRPGGRVCGDVLAKESRDLRLLGGQWFRVSSPAPESKPSLLRLRLTAKTEGIVRKGHPWVYSDSISNINREADVGELGIVYDRNDKLLAIGLYDPFSPIRFRVIHTGKAVKVDRDFWLTRIQACKERRAGLFDETTNANRWISGESDGFPGLVVDRYAEVLVMKLYSAVWLPRIEEIIGCLKAVFQPGAIVLRLSRNIQEIAMRRWQLAEGVLHGATENLVVFSENGILMEAEVIKGQKTGFYLDQRDNRARVEKLAKGRDVLNAFSFSGGFSLYAARGGAKSIADLDISKHALDSAARNYALNPWAASTPHETIQADAFQWLAEGPRRTFDLIVCDPPSLAKRENDRAGAIRAYHALAVSCMRRLRPGGILVAASCSAHVSADEFFGTVLEAAAKHGPMNELWSAGHAPDHPATFPEAHYLKCIALQMGPAR